MKNMINGKTIALAATGIILAAALVVTAAYTKTRITGLQKSNTELMDQISANRRNVYTASKDIAKGEKLVTTGAGANVQISQIYTSLDPAFYISEDSTGFAQTDIKMGTPVLTSFIGTTNPLEEQQNALNDAVTDAVKKMTEQQKVTLPYKVIADFLDENGNKLADSQVLTLDDGTNEKAFNMAETQIDNYVLKSIMVEGKSVHSFGVSVKKLKAGDVTLYYYTTKKGWDRIEIKGNIHVEYTYVPAATAGEDDVLNEEGSAGITVEDTASTEASTETVSVDSTEETDEVASTAETTAEEASSETSTEDASTK